VTKRRHRTRKQLEDALLAFELTERRVWLALSVWQALVAAVCAVHNSPWPLSAGLGGSSSLTAAVSALGRRRGR
jgi:hypothetical protein